jgi:hypothetical protein
MRNQLLFLSLDCVDKNIYLASAKEYEEAKKISTLKSAASIQNCIQSVVVQRKHFEAKRQRSGVANKLQN